MNVSNNPESNQQLAAAITRSASKQTYYTIRFLVDRDLVADAYRAYGYFRWVDDQLDQSGMGTNERLVFVERQKSLMAQCYRGERPRHPSAEESMLVELIRSERGKRSGLQSYIRNMMAVMSFDAGRRGRLISQDELNEYTRALAVAVTEAMHYFIGHGSRSPQGQTRHLAVTAAHITHMLRDTLEDVEAGYFNISREIATYKANRIETGSRAASRWPGPVSNRDRAISPRLRTRAAAWRVLPTRPASRRCYPPSNGTIIVCGAHILNAKVWYRPCG
jgi:phytoene/squalene synthetase